jgi:type I restriction enzyme, S subunit
MKPYPKYKYSGVEWIGDVPERWDILPIKYVVKIPVTDGPHETPELLNEGIPFISAEAIKNDKIDFGKKRGFISIEEHKRFSEKYKPQKGDIYMIKSGATTGNIAVVETDDEFNIWSPLAAIRPDLKKTTTKFLFHFMKSINFFESIEIGWSFGTQQNIGMGVIENLPIVAPSIEEQISIAAYLDRKTTQIDNLISKKQKLIELLKEERAAIINQAVTKGLNPDAPMKDSGIEWLGEIPEHWEVKRLKFLVNKVGSGVTPRGGASVYQNDGIPLLRSQNIHFDGLRLDDVAYISEEIHNEMSGSKVRLFQGGTDTRKIGSFQDHFQTLY